MGLFGLFGKNKGSSGKGKSKGEYAFVFICRGPDPSGLTNILQGIGMTGDGLYEAMQHFGYTGSRDHVIMYGPNWNDTVYSSWLVKGPGEADDLIGKMKAKIRADGYSYNGENIKTARYAEETSYAQMGFFMAYVFITV